MLDSGFKDYILIIFEVIKIFGLAIVTLFVIYLIGILLNFIGDFFGW
jgi:hypothetical protein